MILKAWLLFDTASRSFLCQGEAWAAADYAQDYGLRYFSQKSHAIHKKELYEIREAAYAEKHGPTHITKNIVIVECDFNFTW